ncbi:MAG: universal stress protein [Gammaproteobacteria bacterium]|nr:universal stress protein [Gammaproteobacteria bacterium]MDH3505638.1 universal stress protein [Gammaproteobacteria bacterium]
MPERNQQFQKLFVVIDPTRMVQPALIKGEWLAAKDNASLHMYCCVYDERFAADEAEQQTELRLMREWLDRLAAPARENGLNVEVDIEWNSDWRTAVLEAAKAAKAGLVIKTASQHSAVRRRLMKTSDWLLLNKCTSPVLLVSDHRLWENKRALAAVKLKPEDKLHEQLNADLLDVSHSLAERAELELYAATAYQGDDMFFDRQKFADLCRLPRSSVFAEEGAPERAIANVADNIKADVIVIGNPGEAKRNTARLLIDQVAADLLVLPNA